LDLSGHASRGIYYAEETGAVYVPERSLSEIVSNVSGLSAVVNYAQGSTGRGAESDAELRRNIRRRQIRSSGNEVAIQNAIEAVNDVEYAAVYSNRTEVEVSGRPPNCFESLVVGGDDQEIAQAIFDAGPAGIQAFGNVLVQVQDIKGNLWPIGFSRPVNRYIWMKIIITKYDEEEFPVDGLDQVQDQIQEWATANLGVGVDVLYQRFNLPIYEVPGISMATIKIAVTAILTPPAASAYTATNIPISEMQIARVDKSRIEVTLA
jgi:hypothetical protein